MSAALRRHVTAVQGRSHQAASIREDVANPHKLFTRSPCDITFERISGEEAISHGQGPSRDQRQNWIGLKHEAYQAMWDRGGEQLLDGFPEGTKIHGGVQTEQSLFQ